MHILGRNFQIRFYFALLKNIQYQMCKIIVSHRKFISFRKIINQDFSKINIFLKLEIRFEGTLASFIQMRLF